MERERENYIVVEIRQALLLPALRLVTAMCLPRDTVLEMIDEVRDILMIFIYFNKGALCYY
jgi:hypothetical protein